MQTVYDKMANRLGQNINKYTLWAQQIGNHHWRIYYLIMNLISLTFTVETYLQYIHNDSENTEKRLIIIPVYFVLA